ncbi:MAG: NADH-quinone oxidoreductase subunit J [candidate division Zixibacteria bacterium]|nr:NADH-quinone oxidoreductase subunit J [candidate division Zixibacteria bacterium]
MSLDALIFVISAVVAVFSATMMIAQRNPVASVLYLIVSLIAQAVLYVQLGALFLGSILIIVYAGAILVLFLFVIMLLNLRGKEDLGEKSPLVNQATKFIVSILFVVELVFAVRSGFVAEGIAADAADFAGFGSVENVATLLFTRYLYPFELTSILLLAAIVGAVVMARRENRDEQQYVSVEQTPPETFKEGQG